MLCVLITGISQQERTKVCVLDLKPKVVVGDFSKIADSLKWQLQNVASNIQ